MTKKVKYFIFTLIYYGILTGLSYLLEKWVPGDMCNPGAGIVFLVFILPLLTFGIIIRKIYLITKGKKEYALSLLTDIGVLITLLIYFFH